MRLAHDYCSHNITCTNPHAAAFLSALKPSYFLPAVSLQSSHCTLLSRDAVSHDVTRYPYRNITTQSCTLYLTSAVCSYLNLLASKPPVLLCRPATASQQIPCLLPTPCWQLPLHSCPAYALKVRSHLFPTVHGSVLPTADRQY
jgi:hypothetical protein